MVAAKAQMATTSHNIANSNTEGYSRQRVQQNADVSFPHGSKNRIGGGTILARTERVNDQYIEKQLRDSGRELSHYEEKDILLRQTEDIFNEMGGEGLNRLIARFFNDFRKLGNEPDNEAVRQSVRESSEAMVKDFKRIRAGVEEVRKHADARLEGFSGEVNAIAETVRDLNIKIKIQELSGAVANDLRDQRDLAMKKLGTYVDTYVHYDKDGAFNVDIRGVGPLVNGPNAYKFGVERNPADDQGKPENSYTLTLGDKAYRDVTHVIKGGKMGAIMDVRDQTLNTILARLDEMASMITTSVNSLHQEGFTKNGVKGVQFFKNLASKDRASEFMELSDAVKYDVNNIAAAGIPNAPSDNRIAIAISQLQNLRVMDGGTTSIDDYYNGMVSDVGVISGRNKEAMTQQKDIQNQLAKIREQTSGVSLDEETANLLQFQRAFDASAKVIQVADDCLKTVLDLRR